MENIIKKMKIIIQIQDDDYQNNHSQNIETLQDWPRWFWGQDSKDNLYCKGKISGFSYNDWVLVREITLPFAEEEICRLANFIKK